jgi:adenine-specific DNA-methyltransferase
MGKPVTLFDDILLDAPSTEGVKYAGSKLKLLPHVLNLAAKTKAKTVLDGFSGTTRVSQAFAKSGYQVVSNDIATWSETFGKCYLLNKLDRHAYKPLIEHLNSVAPKDGWFSENYGGSPETNGSIERTGLKKPWQIHNTRKLDGIREEITRLRLSDLENALALTSLILALDRVDSTLGHFASYLKDWSPRSFNTLHLEVPRVFANKLDHQVTQCDVFDAASRDVDLAYLDPPYGSNNEKMPPSRVRYAAYYHIWKTICLDDRPELFGKALRRIDTSDRVATSVFEEFRKNPQTNRFIAVEALERLIKQTKAPWLILSYSSGGRATAEELNAVLSENGIVRDIIELDYKRNVMSGMKWTNQWISDAEVPNREFLFLIEKC